MVGLLPHRRAAAYSPRCGSISRASEPATYTKKATSIASLIKGEKSARGVFSLLLSREKAWMMPYPRSRIQFDKALKGHYIESQSINCYIEEN